MHLPGRERVKIFEDIFAGRGDLEDRSGQCNSFSLCFEDDD